MEYGGVLVLLLVKLALFTPQKAIFFLNRSLPPSHKGQINDEHTLDISLEYIDDVSHIIRCVPSRLIDQAIT